MTMKQVATYAAAVFATLAVLVLLWQFRAVLGLFALSLFVAAMVRPLALRLVAVGIPAPAAQLVVYAGGLTLAGLLVYALSGPLLAELQSLTSRLTIIYEANYDDWLQGSGVGHTIATRLLPPDQLYEALTGPEGQELAGTLLGITQGIIGAVAGLALILVLSLYWSTDQAHFERLWLSLLPARYRIRARNGWREIETAVGAYLRSEMVQSLLAALLLGLGYWLLQLPYPLLLALLAALASLVPLLGAIFIAVAALLVGLLFNTIAAVAAVVYTLAVLLMLELVVEPYLFNRRRSYSVMVILTIIPLVDAFGLLGLLIAPPIAVTVQVLLRQVFDAYVMRSDTAVQFSNLEQRYGEVREVLAHSNGTAFHPETENVLQRLGDLLEQTREVAERP